MTKDLKYLEQLFKLARKHGVETLEFEGVKLSLSHNIQPLKTLISNVKRPKRYQDIANDTFDPGHIPMPSAGLPPGAIPQPEEQIPHDGPTEEQLLFGSSDPSVWNKPQ